MSNALRFTLGFVAAVFLLLVTASVLLAQPVPTVAVVDAGDAVKGLLVSFISHTQGQIVVLLTSAITFVVHKWTDLTEGWSTTKVYFLLTAIGEVASFAVHALGGQLSADPTTWTAATGSGLAAAAVAGIVYKLGGKR